jgi:hypothetical protein
VTQQLAGLPDSVRHAQRVKPEHLSVTQIDPLGRPVAPTIETLQKVLGDVLGNIAGDLPNALDRVPTLDGLIVDIPRGCSTPEDGRNTPTLMGL